ncbi:hypothetical protein QBC32DRAFT_385766 [Pseudoneurospora amorphoporcata]|uniref:F-box domain-containing protein n=1 Tax=Pseudoneurospora amorphoporcata TaxID=241081 RepID=A0AAN6NN56_9PEZI|nr:hypothetical protein QBC32DRAFT_385766 [Pseudoneurospora amorphoporcata]
MALTRFRIVCNLCQAIIPPVEQDLNNDDGPIPRLEWHQETRAVRAIRDTSSPFLTGVGYLTRWGVLQASHNPDVPYRTDTGLLNLGARNDAILSQSGNGQANHPKYLTFVFHDVCWQLFLAGILLGLPDSVTTCRTPQEQVGLVAEALFRYLSCMPLTKLNQVVVPHDLPPYRAAHLVLPRDYAPTDRAIMMADPSDLPTLDGSPQVVDHQHNDHLYTINPNFHSASSTDTPLSTLPEELIHQILNLLPSPDVCNLRLVSRSVASVSSPLQLPRSFWASRFQCENEMGFFYPGRPFPDTKPPTDYRQLHSTLRLELSKVTEVMNLRNRRRIWRMLREMSCCITLAIEHMWSSTNGDSDTGTPFVHIPEGHVAGRLVCPLPLRGGPVTKALERSVGTTIFARQAAIFPDLLLQAPMCVGVSFLRIDQRPYVCGIRVLSARSDQACRVGVIIQESETIVALKADDELSGFRVACLANGVVGLGLLIRPVSNPECVPMLHPFTVGNLDTSTSGLGLADITPTGGGLPTGIIAGLDAACRIVSLQLLECQSSFYKEEEDISTGPFAKKATQPRSQAVMWSPSIPPNEQDILTPKTKPGIHGSVAVREDQGSDFVLNIPFGGERGERLKTLNRIVAYTDPYSAYGAFKGFGFHYDDEPAEVFYGTRKEYGSFPIAFRQCLQSSFTINGNGGEVIDHIELFGLVSQWYKLDAIKVCDPCSSIYGYPQQLTNPVDYHEFWKMCPLQA